MDKKELFYKINDVLLNYQKPSDFFIKNINEKIFNEYPLNQIRKLKEIEQNPKWHSEGNVFNHTMLVIDAGATKRDTVEDKKAFMWGLLLHDIGKITTTKIHKGKITSYNHEKEGVPMAIDFLRYFDFLDEKFILDVSKIVRWHMEVLFTSKNLDKFSQLDKLVTEIDINTIATVAYCDRMGRLNVDEEEVNESINIFLEKAKNIL